MQLVPYLPVITNSSEDTLAIFHGTNVIGDLYRLLARMLVVALAAKLVVGGKTVFLYSKRLYSLYKRALFVIQADTDSSTERLR